LTWPSKANDLFVHCGHYCLLLVTTKYFLPYYKIVIIFSH
jgi:hypothetical protein